MLTRAQQISVFIKENVEKHPRDIVSVTAAHFPVSRPAIHQQLNKLIKSGQILKIGKTKGVHYYVTNQPNKQSVFKIQPGLEEHEVWKTHLQDSLSKLQENVYDICHYGFTEIFNNAVEHSEGKKVVVQAKWLPNQIELLVVDDGVGIFRKIKSAFHLSDDRESVLQLIKGKLTTDPQHHTGEGVFFTSRVFDIFSIHANGLCYLKNNLTDDWFLEKRDKLDEPGTGVFMTIQINSNRLLKSIFEDYTGKEGSKFTKTHFIVELSKLPDEKYISRSQAKRILSGLENFKHVVLDFKGVNSVGQGFVDEVFRVFQQEHPGITIEYVNAAEDVKFMIERGIPEKANPAP